MMCCFDTSIFRKDQARVFTRSVAHRASMKKKCVLHIILRVRRIPTAMQSIQPQNITDNIKSMKWFYPDETHVVCSLRMQDALVVTPTGVEPRLSR